VVRELLRSPYRVRSVLVSPKRLEKLAGALEEVDAPVYVAERSVINAVSGIDLHRGAVASAERGRPRRVEEVLAGARAVAVLEGITDHENLGVVFRNAAALGIDGILVDPTCCDPFYRRAVRVSMGHVLGVPWTRLDRWPAGLDEVSGAGFTLVALTPDPAADPIDALDPVPPRAAILLGTESSGLSSPVLDRADHRVRIAMAAGVDSLNVAAAAAIAFHCLGPLSRGR
jgi:tRNA G18 (ribose-2'-O)-methylase SpoU